MRIKHLTLTNFRNYEKLSLSFHEGLHVFTGENAQGKTNLLEAIFVCALGRSHRTKGDAEMIREGYDTAKIRLLFEDRLGMRSLEPQLSRTFKKRVLVDEKPLARSVDQMGVFNAVMFSPEDLSLVKNGPSERRRFLDMELSQVRPLYCAALQRYNRAHRQRNALLKLHTPDLEHLSIWEAQMAEAAAHIAFWRACFTARLHEIAGELHARVCRGRENITVAYESCLKDQFDHFLCDSRSFEESRFDLSGYACAFADALKKHREADMRRGATSFGIHREDLNILINQRSARLFASQGQQRTAALSLKLSEIALVYELRRDTPVVLLDDVLSELDEYRRRLLFDVIGGAQTLVTCTGAEGYRPKGARTYVVREGRIEEQ